jgi:hypothetical protein
VPSLLVTNDFPPKVGGIQSYLWELWRRLPADQVTVLTTPYEGATEFDRTQRFRVVRDRDRVLLPTPALARRIDSLAEDVGATLIFLDPALPLGALGPRLRAAPYVVVLHGAEVTVPGRLAGSRTLLRRRSPAARPHDPARSRRRPVPAGGRRSCRPGPDPQAPRPPGDCAPRRRRQPPRPPEGLRRPHRRRRPPAPLDQ